MKQPERIESPQGKLAVFLPGMGAVATTFIAGCLLARKEQALPIGSLTQMGTIRLGKRIENRAPKIPRRELDSSDSLPRFGTEESRPH